MFIDKYTMTDTEYTLINKKDKVSLPSQSLRIKGEDRDMNGADIQEL